MTHSLDRLLEKLPPAIWSKIARIDELKGQWTGGAKLSPQVLGRLKKSALITSTGASTRIEGARMANEDVENYLKGISLQRFSSRDKGEVKGYYELLELVFDQWKHIRLTENTVKHLHKELLKNVEKDRHHLGEYKKTENRVLMLDAKGQAIATIFETTPPYLTAKEMEELVSWTNTSLKRSKYHPLLIIACFIVEFLKIHPFQDGNGRLSRILTNLLLLQSGYLYTPYVSHEKLIEDNKPEYYLGLRKSQKSFGTKNETVEPWLTFFLDIMLKQAKIAMGLLSEENIDKLLSPKQIAVWDYLKQVAEATPAELSAKTGIARPTINQVLTKLLDLKRIERIGLGRSTRYRVIA